MTTRTRTATRRSGDDYQDLVAIESLLRVLKHPSRYEWVKLEAREAGKLDDVLVLSADGVIEATQVKFSTDPMRPRDPWTWQKLLALSKGGTSLIQDWCRSIDQLDNEFKETVPRLVSNRRAGRGLHLLPNGRVDVESTAPSIRQIITSQLGEKTSDFLERFRFEIDEQDLPALNERLSRQFTDLGVSDHGYLSLRETVRTWIRCEHLPPNGEIRLNDIRSACLWHGLVSLPQNLEVPVDYTLPPNFHHHFLSRVREGSGSAIVLTAGPGVGKSTYLSHLVQELEEAQQPVIRHHYALRAIGSERARLEAPRVAESLMSDISANLGQFVGDLAVPNPEPEDLRFWIIEVAKRLQEDGQFLVVVVDGLDHVWREDDSREELNKLFDILTPVPEGVVLVVGTQPVADSQLPNSLLRITPRDEWVNLPGLDERAISDWLVHYCNLMPSEWNHEGEHWYRTQLANALFAKTKGHPLLLRYIVERIALLNEHLTIDSIEAIPEVPAGTVEEYYHALWVSIPAEARDILFLLALAKFTWPEDALINCLQLAGSELSSSIGGLESIRHLLGRDAIGTRVFHRSLPLYAMGQPEFADRAASLRNAIIEWLATQAPKFWQRSYLWSLQLEAGDGEPLLAGTDREWTVQSIAEGHPTTEVAHILESAAWHAIEVGNFPIYVDRGILADVVSSTELQDEVLRLMYAAQLVLSKDEYLEPRSIADISELSDLHVLELGFHLHRRGMADKAAGCLGELKRRLGRLVDDEFETADQWTLYGLVAQLSGAIERDPEEFVRLLASCYSESMQLAITLGWAAGLRRSHEVRAPLRVLKLPVSPPVERHLSRHVAVRAAYEGMRLSPGEQQRLIPLYAAIYRTLYDQQEEVSAPQEPCTSADITTLSHQEYSGGTSQYVHDLFFFLIIRELESQGAAERWKPDEGLSIWFTSALTALAQAAKNVAAAWRNEGCLPVTAAYDATKDLERPALAGHPADRQKASNIESALETITEDLLAFRGANNGEYKLSWEEFQTISAHIFSSDRNILSWIVEETVEVSPQAIEALCSSLDEKMSDAIEPYSQRAELFALLAIACARYGLQEKGMNYLYQSANNLLGYGYHKDILLHITLNTLEALADDSGVRQHVWIKLAPAIGAINEFTDGDETAHLPARLGMLLLRFDSGLAVKYAKSLMDAERYNDVENILREMVRDNDLTDPIIRALVSTCIDPHSIRMLEERANNPESQASPIVNLTPRYSSAFASREKASTESISPFPGQPDKLIESFGRDWHLEFPPDRLEGLVTQESLVWPHDRAKRLSYWLLRWSETESRDEALEALEPYFLQNDRLAVSNETVSTVRKIGGRERSYDWLVRAQRSNSGWRDYQSNFDQAKERWDILKKDFPGRWRNFLVESIRPQRGFSPWFGVTTTRMVIYLIDFDRREEARAVTMRLVDTVCEVVSGQYLPMPEWTGQGTNSL